MPRSLFALCLFLFAASAMAGAPVVGDDNAAESVKPAKASSSGSAPEGNAAVGGRPAATPARSNAPHAVTPRWHSLLPGMIR